MKALYTFLTILVISTTAISQTIWFEENFDSLTAGQGVACQDTAWTTWSNEPCGPEDPLVSSAFSFNTPHSALIIPNNDFVKILPNWTTGDYSVHFMFYIPAGKSGYFNVLHVFNGGNSQWGFECYFNADGTADVNAGGTGTATFNYTQGVWSSAELRVNLDADSAMFMYADTLQIAYQWSTGATGTGTLNQLGGVNFYGAETTNEFYVDDFHVFINGPTGIEDPLLTVTEFALDQNYPNPFNPSTVITYSIPEASNVTLTIYNMLGEKVASLINDFVEAGKHTVNFNSAGLSSGVYFYKIEAGQFTDTRKMILSK